MAQAFGGWPAGDRLCRLMVLGRLRCRRRAAVGDGMLLQVEQARAEVAQRVGAQPETCIWEMPSRKPICAWAIPAQCAPAGTFHARGSGRTSQ
jgi:hypothetical protein